MRRRAAIGVGALVLAILLVGPATARRRPSRPGCGAACRTLGGVGGGAGYCGPATSSAASITAARRLTMEGTGIGPNDGDLLLAAIVSQGADEALITPPPGWTKVPNTDHSTANGHLRVYYKIAASNDPLTIPFTWPFPVKAFGTVSDFNGASTSQPIVASAGQANPTPSLEVTAPSITPSSANTMLVFVGASNPPGTWTAPPGMTAQHLNFSGGAAHPASIGIATEHWPTAAATGTRTARISTAGASVGDLIALKYPRPVTCPRLQLVTNHFHATANGVFSARLTCRWGARCIGAFIGLGPKAERWAASDIAVGAGHTSTVQVALTPAGERALRRRGRLELTIFLWAIRANGQPALAGGGVGHVTPARGAGR